MKRTNVYFILSLLLLILFSSCKEDELVFQAGASEGDHFSYQGTPKSIIDPGGDTFLGCGFDINGNGEDDLYIDLGGQYFQGQLVRDCRIEALRGVDYSADSLVNVNGFEYAELHLLEEGEDVLTGQNWYDNGSRMYMGGWQQGEQIIGLRWGGDPYAYAWVRINIDGCSWTLEEWAFMP